jgi:hypothetical protein
MYDSLSFLQKFTASGARKSKVSKPKFIYLYMYIQKKLNSILHFKILLSKKKKLKEIIHFLVKRKN